MKKTINNIEFTTCTATYITAGWNKPEPAIMVHDLADEFHDGDTLIWDEEMPENEQDVLDIFQRMQENVTRNSTYSEDLETIVW